MDGDCFKFIHPPIDQLVLLELCDGIALGKLSACIKQCVDLVNVLREIKILKIKMLLRLR